MTSARLGPRLFYFDLDFVGIGWRNIRIFDFQNGCITIFVAANDARHDFSSNLQPTRRGCVLAVADERMTAEDARFL
jgi:hypothetical protein